MNIYKTNKTSINTLCHIDAYRLKSSKDLSAIGAQEYFGQADTITVIEWAEKIKKILPRKTRLIKINLSGKIEREIIY